MSDEINKKLREKYADEITTNGNKLTKKKKSILLNIKKILFSHLYPNKTFIHEKNIKHIIKEKLINNEILDEISRLKAQQKFDELSKSLNLNEIRQKQENLVNPNSYFEKLGIKSIKINISNEIMKIANPETNGLLLPAIAQLRASLADATGYILPNIFVTDNPKLKKYQYSILIREQEVFKGCVSEEDVINNDTKEIIKNLKDVCIKYVHQIMTRSDALKIMELVKSEDPTLVNDLIPTFLSSTDIKKILANLIHDGFSIKDILLIFEQLNDHARYTQDTDELTEIIKNELMFYLN